MGTISISNSPATAGSEVARPVSHRVGAPMYDVTCWKQ